MSKWLGCQSGKMMVIQTQKLCTSPLNLKLNVMVQIVSSKSDQEFSRGSFVALNLFLKLYISGPKLAVAPTLLPILS